MLGKNKAEMVREGVVKGQAWTLGCPELPFLQLLLLSSWVPERMQGCLAQLDFI